MSDTQWPRYEVFQQVKEGQPHRNVGSVHAVDAEMALQNARDVFVRRPQTINLWVVPAAEILMVTQEKINENPDLLDFYGAGRDDLETYLVFQKTSQRPSMTYVVHTGEVRASSPEGAMEKALDHFGSVETYSWWIFPEKAVNRSDECDVEVMFSQARDKTYRMPQDYQLLAKMMQLKRGEG